MKKRIDIDALLKSISFVLTIVFVFTIAIPAFSAICNVKVATAGEIIKPEGWGIYADCNMPLIPLPPKSDYGDVRCVNDTVVHGYCGPDETPISEKSICETYTETKTINIRYCSEEQRQISTDEYGNPIYQTFKICKKTSDNRNLTNARIQVIGGNCE